jgi:hypothetical protein
VVRQFGNVAEQIGRRTADRRQKDLQIQAASPAPENMPAICSKQDGEVVHRSGPSPELTSCEAKL